MAIGECLAVKVMVMAKDERVAKGGGGGGKRKKHLR